MRVWVNFKELRQRLRFEDVLKHYQVEVRRKGDQHQGFCPLPNHGGNKNSASFSANLERGIFQCFGCGAKGNVLEFAALMSGADPSNGDALRAVAVELQRKFVPSGTSSRPATNVSQTDLPKPQPTRSVVNAPLDFELKDLDHGHAYLAGRGFKPETMAHFGVGFCSRGMLKDRVALPLYDTEGRLLGYAGRVIDDTLISPENPKYRFPSCRERGGIVYEFRKSLFVYNGFRVAGPVDDLIVVEGFASVWWLAQSGFPQVVALMGAVCSDEQAEIIAKKTKPSGRIWLMPDGDKAGERLAQDFLPMLAPVRAVRWAKLQIDQQPTDLRPEEVKAMLSR